MSCSIRAIQAMNNSNPNFHVISMKSSHVFQVSESQNEPQTEAVVRRFSVTKSCNFIKKNTEKFLRIHFFYRTPPVAASAQRHTFNNSYKSNGISAY